VVVLVDELDAGRFMITCPTATEGYKGFPATPHL
jgi:hypothetical protein